jgi:ER-bound oxygenase mpaB/B'/Rubber oxygenase, catalytic domain
MTMTRECLRQLRTVGDPVLGRGAGGFLDFREVLPDKTRSNAWLFECVRDHGVMWLSRAVCCEVSKRKEVPGHPLPGDPCDRSDGSEQLAKSTELGDAWLALWNAPEYGEQDVDADKMRLAHGLFARYGAEISGALLFAALPQTYAARHGVDVLASTGALKSNLRRRIRGTAQFLIAVMMGAESSDQAKMFWSRDSPRPALHATLGLRLFHHAVRLELANRVKPDVPINQADLLATVLTFTISTFEVLERYGITWTEEEQEAYFYAWGQIGDRLGIGRLPKHPPRALAGALGPGSFIPPDIASARQTLELIRSVEWAEADEGDSANGEIRTPRWEEARQGRMLTKALLDELSTAMPRVLKPAVPAVMRTLAPPAVRDRLGLGTVGLPMALLERLPRRRHLVARFTDISTANHVSGVVLRTLANQCARYSMIHFLEGEPPFEYPGLDDWVKGVFPAS